MSADLANGDFQWYVIHTNPKQEDRAESNLRAWNVETYNPKLREVRHSPYGEPGHIIKPLFPRYIFARFGLKELFHKVRFTRGVYNILGFGNGPTPVDEEIINIIKLRTDNLGFVKIGPDLEPGDEIIIEDGPLKSFTGIFEQEMKDSCRVMILLNTVSYQGRLIISREQIKKAS